MCRRAGRVRRWGFRRVSEGRRGQRGGRWTLRWPCGHVRRGRTQGALRRRLHRHRAYLRTHAAQARGPGATTATFTVHCIAYICCDLHHARHVHADFTLENLIWISYKVLCIGYSYSMILYVHNVFVFGMLYSTNLHFAEWTESVALDGDRSVRGHGAQGPRRAAPLLRHTSLGRWL